MIPVQEIVDRITSILDAEGSDRYLFDQDFKPAINSAKDWVVAVFKKVFADKSMSEENLRELVKVAIYQTNTFSRIALDESVLGDSIWSILSVNPEAVTYPNGNITTPSNDYESLFRPDLTYTKSNYSAKRLTFEEWENMRDNIFMAGSPALTNSLREYSYLSQSNLNSTNYTATAPEIEISPELVNKLVGIRYLKYPNNVSLLSDDLEFPRLLFDMIVNKAANFMSIKQGDQTNLYTVTAKDVNYLIQLMT